MIGLAENFAAPNVASRSLLLPALPVGATLENRCPRVAKVWVGDEPVAILMDAHCNVLLGVAANRWTPAIDKMLDRLLGSKDADMNYRRSETLESILEAGFVYLTFRATAELSRDAASCMILRQLLKGALLVSKKSYGTMALPKPKEAAL